MSDNLDRSVLDPTQLASRAFGTGFRGYDQDEVRSFLRRVAAGIEHMLEEQAALRLQVEELERKLAEPPQLSDEEIAAALGEETAKVIASAKAAATEMRANAEEDVARLRAEAEQETGAARAEADEYATTTRREIDEARDRSAAESATVRQEAEDYAGRIRSEADEAAATARSDAEADAARRIEEADEASAAKISEAETDAARIRDEANSILSVRSAEADDEAARIRAAAEEEADRIRAEAEETRTQAGLDAEAERESAREQGREMVAEAQRVRERVLKDLARRRKSGRQQLEQLRAARERLLEAHETVRRTLEEATNELLVSLPDARVAAVDAGRRAEHETEATVDELEAEIHAAREAGLPLVSANDDHSDTDHLHDSAADVEDTLGPAPDVELEPPAVDEAPEPEPEPEPVAPAPPVSEMVEVAEQPAEPQEPEADDAGPAEPVESSTVDELFARLRAERETPEPEPEAESELETAAEAVDPVDITDSAEPDEVEPEAEGDATVLSLLERRDAITDEIERSLAKRLKRVLADEQNAVLDAVRRARKVPAPEDVIPDPPEHEGSFATAAIEDLTAAAAAGVAFHGADGTPPAPQVEDLAQALAAELTGPIRPRLERCFEDLGGDDEELMNRLRTSYREWKSPRIIEVTRHHVLAAFSRGQFEAMPDGAEVEWVVDATGPACSDAEDNSLAGTVTKGDAFPTGHQFPPAHAGCRCLIVPVAVHVRA
ncbi:MAG: DivIVA domain-containing protein [Acidimicrobiia bacterium]|nr:DivIVA domain-containing protein [Acidimicrobiia bacterium]